MNTLEETDLETLWAGDVECEIDHTITRCTITVVAHATYMCDEDANACQAATTYIVEGIASNDTCDCGRRCSECWGVRAA